jgi:hypothetical protein
MSENPTRVFPSILPSDEEFVDDAYSRAELERMDWDTIRSIAVEYDTDEINGRSDREEIEDWLEGKERI